MLKLDFKKSTGGLGVSAFGELRRTWIYSILASASTTMIANGIPVEIINNIRGLRAEGPSLERQNNCFLHLYRRCPVEQSQATGIN